MTLGAIGGLLAGGGGSAPGAGGAKIGGDQGMATSGARAGAIHFAPAFKSSGRAAAARLDAVEGVTGLPWALILGGVGVLLFALNKRGRRR